jgi:hypothetical protein
MHWSWNEPAQRHCDTQIRSQKVFYHQWIKLFKNKTEISKAGAVQVAESFWTKALKVLLTWAMPVTVFHVWPFLWLLTFHFNFQVTLIIKDQAKLNAILLLDLSDYHDIDIPVSFCLLIHMVRSHPYKYKGSLIFNSFWFDNQYLHLMCLTWTSASQASFSPSCFVKVHPSLWGSINLVPQPVTASDS